MAPSEPAAGDLLVLITGAPGAGKSSVLDALADQLASADVTCGALELEQLAWGHPWLSVEQACAQLRAVVALQRDFGRRCLLLAATTETAQDLRDVLAAVAPDAALVVCLRAEPDTVRDRVLAREPLWWSGRERLAEHARQLATVIPALPGIDLVLDTDGRRPESVATEVRARMPVHLDVAPGGDRGPIELRGERACLRPVRAADGPALREIHASPEVAAWWDPPDPGFPMADDPGVTRFTIWFGDLVAGMIQYAEEEDPKYRHASVDLFVAGRLHRRGIGSEAIRLVVDHLTGARGHHRVTIDPAAHNEAAIACYAKAGFAPVGVLRRAERDADGRGWHDVLFMELVMPAGS